MHRWNVGCALFAVACSAPATGPTIAPTTHEPGTTATQHFKDGEYLFRIRDSVLDSETLTLAGSAASLQLDGREPPNAPTTTRVDQWPSVMSATMKGTVVRTGDHLDIELVAADEAHPLRLACHEVLVDVAPANAVLVVATSSSCLLPSVWSKPTKREAVLQCTGRAGIDNFAPVPGIERVKPGVSYDEGCNPDAVLLRRVEPNLIAPTHL